MKDFINYEIRQSLIKVEECSSPEQVSSAILTIDRALEWRSRHRRNFHAPSALDPPLPPYLLPQQLTAVRFLSYFRVPGSSGELDGITLERLSSLPPISLLPPSSSALYTRPSQPTSHFPLFTLFPAPSYQRRLRRTTLRRSFPLTLYKTRLRPVASNSLVIFFAIYVRQRLGSRIKLLRAF